MCLMSCSFFFNDTATTEIYTYGHTLSLHDALPICCGTISASRHGLGCRFDAPVNGVTDGAARAAYCSCRRAGSRPRRRWGIPMMYNRGTGRQPARLAIQAAALFAAGSMLVPAVHAQSRSAPEAVEPGAKEIGRAACRERVGQHV